MTDDPTTLVSTDWLGAHLRDPDLRVLDASYYLPGAGRDGRAEYDAGHIPGALFFDIDAVSDPGSDLPHMAPAPDAFAAAMRAMGVGDGHQVVVYDGAGLFSAARVWWLFRHMGKRDVAVLDGGLPKWRAEGRAIEDMPPVPRERTASATLRPDLVADIAAVARAVEHGDRQIVDARSPSRFAGTEPEPRAGLRAGHIPGSVNLHYATLLRPDGTLKPPAELERLFTAAGIDPARPIITTCGSGVTAAILALALERIGAPDVALYDGSWAEWGRDDARAVATG